MQASNLLEVQSAELGEGELSAFLKSMQEKHGARAALGVSVFPETRTAKMMLITPENTLTRTLTFGGHPGLLPRWGVNLSLNWLRKAAEGSIQDV